MAVITGVLVALLVFVMAAGLLAEPRAGPCWRGGGGARLLKLCLHHRPNLGHHHCGQRGCHGNALIHSLALHLFADGVQSVSFERGLLESRRKE